MGIGWMGTRLKGEEGGRFHGNAASNPAQAQRLNMSLVPVNGNAARAWASDADTSIGLSFQPLQCTFVVLEMRFKSFEALLVVILSPRRLESVDLRQEPQLPLTLSHCFSSLVSMFSLTIRVWIGTQVRRSKPSQMSPLNSPLVWIVR